MTTDEWLQTNGYKRVATTEWLQPSDYKRMVTTQWLQAGGYKREVTSDWLQASVYKRVVTSGWLQVNGYPKMVIGPRAPSADTEKDLPSPPRQYCLAPLSSSPPPPGFDSPLRALRGGCGGAAAPPTGARDSEFVFGGRMPIFLVSPRGSQGVPRTS